MEEEIIIPKPEVNPPTRDKSWITIDQLEKHCNEFFVKVGDVLFSGDKYNELSKNFVRNVLDFVADHEFITWKQYDSVLRIYSSPKVSRNDTVYTKAVSGTSQLRGLFRHLDTTLKERIYDQGGFSDGSNEEEYF
jgi:hypothetical protein